MLCLLKNWFWKQKSQQGTYQIIKLLIDTIHGLDSKKKKKKSNTTMLVSIRNL